MSEKPVRDRPRRLADWLNPTGDKKVHSWRLVSPIPSLNLRQ